MVAVAGGRAFTFRYPETEELLAAAGCEVVTFDPLTDPALPERHPGPLPRRRLPRGVRRRAGRQPCPARRPADGRPAGVPTVAECAGLLYLAETLDGHPMAGAIPAQARDERAADPALPGGDRRRGLAAHPGGGAVSPRHEFHRTQATPGHGVPPAWTVDGEPEGFVTDTLHASYLHVHWAGHPALARRFAEAVHAASPHVAVGPAVPSRRGSPRTWAARSRRADPLRHHGDVEVGDGLPDFAVNVYPGPPGVAGPGTPREAGDGRRTPMRGRRGRRWPSATAASCTRCCRRRVRRRRSRWSPGCATLAATRRRPPPVHRAPRGARAGRPRR